MQSASQVRRDILAALAGVLIVFTTAFCIPLANMILTINNDFNTGVFLGSPTLSFMSFFFLFLEGAFLAIIISVTYKIIQDYRSVQTLPSS